MLPASQVNPADRAAESKPSLKLHLGTSSSPKAQELRARYEALHAAANQRADFDPKKTQP